MIALVLLCGSASATSQLLYSTSFEPAEGYQDNLDLEEQLGWLGTTPDIINDNGLISGIFTDLGQHAYIGYSGSSNADRSVFVWHPVPLAPIPAARPVVRFSTVMTVIDSSNANLRDRFSWTVFNTNGHQLFSLDFDNADLSINYFLDEHTNAVPTGFTFENDIRYRLEIVMDFALNRWEALLNDVAVATNLPITELNSPLNLGDVDAVWFYVNPAQPGDNYMVFDNYRITSESAASTPRPRLTDWVRLVNGDFLFRVVGEAGRKYAVEASITLTNWVALQTNTADNGFFEFRDRTAGSLSRRFYRARLVP